jgi:hypothetical protein
MYPLSLIEWVSNLILVTKKQGIIRICVDYMDLNKDCLKNNYPTPCVDQIIDECDGSEIFSFMNGFVGCNQIQIIPEDRNKTSFIFLSALFLIESFHLVLKILGPLSSSPCHMLFTTSNTL